MLYQRWTAGTGNPRVGVNTSFSSAFFDSIAGSASPGFWNNGYYGPSDDSGRVGVSEQFAGVTAGGTIFFQTLDASVTTSATVTKQVGKIASATVTSTVTLARQTGKVASATVTSTASLARRVGKTAAATVTASASLAAQKVILKTLTATTVNLTASLVKQVGKPLTATTVTTTATVVKRAGKTLTATVTTSASLAALRVYLRTLTASTVTVSSSMVRQVGKPLAVTVTGTPTLVKQVGKRLTASSITTSASLAAQRVFLRAMTATITATATVTRRTGKLVTATAATAVTVQKRVAHTIGAAAAITAALVAEITGGQPVGHIDAMTALTAADDALTFSVGTVEADSTIAATATAGTGAPFGLLLLQTPGGTRTSGGSVDAASSDTVTEGNTAMTGVIG